MELAGATWPQVEATGARTVLAVPLGSLEQHGPHLPSTPTPASPWPWPRAWRRAVPASPWRPPSPTGRAASTPTSRARCSSVTRSWPTCSSSWCAPPAAPSPAWCSSAPTAGNEEALAAVRAPRARPRGTTCSSWRATTPGGDAHAGRTETSLHAGHRRRRPCALDLAEPGCTEPLADAAAPSARRRGAAGIVQRRAGRSRRVRPPTRAGRCSTTLVRDLTAAVVVALVALVSPAAVVTGAARGIGAATVDAARGRRLAGGGGGPLRRRSGPGLRPGHEGRPRGGGRAPRRRRAHGGGRRAQRIGHAAPPWTRPSGTSGACRPRSPRPA